MKNRAVNRMKWIGPLMVLAMTLVVAQGCAPIAGEEPVEENAAATPAPSNIPEVGALAPSVELMDLEGNQFKLSDYRGKIVLLNFWATWCPPCRSEIPGFVEVYDDYSGKGLEIVAVSVGEKEDVVSGFAKDKGMRFPVLLDQDGMAARQYLVRSIPTNVFVDREGVVRRISSWRDSREHAQALSCGVAVR